MSTERPDLSRRSLAAEQIGNAVANLYVAAQLLANDEGVSPELREIRELTSVLDSLLLRFNTGSWGARKDLRFVFFSTWSLDFD